MVQFFGDFGSLINSGTMSSPTRTGYNGDNDSSFNYGVVNAASPVLLGQFSRANDRLVNGGTISANDFDDAAQTFRLNNGVLVEGADLVTNLAAGTIIAVSSEGAGVRFNGNGGNSVLQNLGHIESLQDFGVNLATVYTGAAPIRVYNWGTISGGDGAYNGSVNADLLVSRGQLIGGATTNAGADTLDNCGCAVEGDVDLGAGNDRYVGTGGSLIGAVHGGAGADTFFGNENAAEVFVGGADVDTLDFRLGGQVTLALDLSFAQNGAALGDTYFEMENVFGSDIGDDVIRSNGFANALFGFAGNDSLDGASGNDVLRGGIGNDAFRFSALNECGDVITDFGNTVSSDDRFQITAAAFGGGLVAGALTASQFITRAGAARRMRTSLYYAQDPMIPLRPLRLRDSRPRVYGGQDEQSFLAYRRTNCAASAVLSQEPWQASGR